MAAALRDAAQRVQRENIITITENLAEHVWHGTLWYDDAKLDDADRQYLAALPPHARPTDTDTAPPAAPTSRHLLRPGESLRAGQFLESKSGRYRLYLLPNGKLELYMYATDQRLGREVVNRRIKLFPLVGNTPLPWPDAGPGGRLVLQRDQRQDAGRLQLLNAAGAVVWFGWPRFYGVGSRSAFLKVQDDGNIVHYVDNDRGRMAFWSPDSHDDAAPYVAQAVRPNKETLVITGGQLSVSANGQTNANIINETDEPIGVRDARSYDTIPPGGSVEAASVAGVLEVELVQYQFNEYGDQEDEGRTAADFSPVTSTIRKEVTESQIKVIVSSVSGGLRLT
ncbi:MAG: hypothetical protein KDB14_19770 [Planctomycetales bacterium]|nr:hypothetical protein [Planctomycetales bacterium]